MEKRTSVFDSFNSYGGDIAVMRHLDDRAWDQEEVVCRKIIRKFVENISMKSVKKVMIYHSPLYRAEKTAEIVAINLKTLDLKTETKPLYSLSCAEYSISISINQVLKERRKKTGGIFILLISHQPDIEHFLDYNKNVSNGAIFARDFEIHRYKL